MTNANHLLPLYRASALGWWYNYLAVPWEHLNLSAFPRDLFQHHDSGQPPLGLQSIRDCAEIVSGDPRPWTISPEGEKLLQENPPSIRHTVLRIRGVLGSNRSFPRLLKCQRLSEKRACNDQLELAKFISRTKVYKPLCPPFVPCLNYDRELRRNRYQNLLYLYADMHILTMDANEGKMIK